METVSVETKGKATKWVEALRSGKYEQGAGALRRTDSGEARYCCLGVLCLVYQEETGKNTELNIGYPMRGVGLWLEGKEAKIEPDSFFQRLAQYNDEGVDFDTIADVIEAHYRLKGEQDAPE